MRRIACILFALVAASAYADFTVQLDAGQLRGAAGAVMPAGSLLILVEAGGDNSFSNSLAPGQYVSGNDILLSAMAFPSSAGAFNTSGGTNETINVFTNLPTTNPGDYIALRWFPQITYASFLTGTTPLAGQNYGTYNPIALGNSTNNPDGGNLWVVPSDGSTINLNFYTTDSDGSGTQTASFGWANFTVTAVPEPSSLILELLGGVAVGVGLLRRRRR